MGVMRLADQATNKKQVQIHHGTFRHAEPES